MRYRLPILPDLFIGDVVKILLASGLVVNCITVSNASETDALERANAHYEHHEYKKAAREISEYLSNNHDDGNALRLRGKCYLNLNELEKAMDDFDATKQLPGPLEIAKESADSINVNDDERGAYPIWLQALVFMYAARVNADQGQYARAIKFCEIALNKVPVFPECTAMRANLCLKQKRYYEAEEEYRTAISLRPHDWHSWFGYSLVLQKQVKYQEAYDALMRGLVFIQTPQFPEPDLNKRVQMMLDVRADLQEKIGRKH